MYGPRTYRDDTMTSEPSWSAGGNDKPPRPASGRWTADYRANSKGRPHDSGEGAGRSAP
jgi:hypothetical protein